MTTISSIEWTEATWNPVVGCIKVSAGCKNCYAEVMARRLQAMGVEAYRGGFTPRLLPERLNEPLTRRKPTLYFVNSMSDLFQEAVPDAFIDRVMEVMRAADWHTFQVLTKRSGRMTRYFASRPAPPKNVWLGVSVENKKHGLPRVAHLAEIKGAAVRFLSVEPLLEDLGQVDLHRIDWVIVGGESGHYARPMRLEWVRKIKTQCDRAGASFFFKQWGAWGSDGVRRNKAVNGREFEGRTWDAMPVAV